MLIHPAPLQETATKVRANDLDLLDYIDRTCALVELVNPKIHALLPEPDRLNRLRKEASELQRRYPNPADRPPLYGVLVGVKDIFRVDGFPTQAGSTLPPEVLSGKEASVVTLLRDKGALILGKTVTAEFAYFEPGETRNPYNVDHTPGGSSSGSAAAVAAGLCSLALGTQTIGSTIRPAAYCEIVGFKPSYGRIATDGVIAVSKSLDHVGLFTQDAAGMALAASLLCKDWNTSQPDPKAPLPVLGIPTGPYLDQASPEGRDVFNIQVAALEKAGYTVKRIPTFYDIETLRAKNMRLMFSEMAGVHADWFAHFEPLYRRRTADAIRDGQFYAKEGPVDTTFQHDLRDTLEALMNSEGIDLWIAPSATGPAPEGLASTGDAAMNLPWTLAGLPTLGLPAGMAAHGLPLGLQCIGPWMADERLLQWGQPLGKVLHALI